MAETPSQAGGRLIRDIEREKIGRAIVLPLSEAFRMSWRNITIRLGRSIITASGIFLGIAFYVSVMASATFLQAIHEQAAKEFVALGQEQAEQAAMQARQIWLVVMALLVSLVGISNSMLMSVTERFREIGTMKCLGALDSFIVKIYLIESMLLGFFGSLFGSGVGFGFMYVFYHIKYPPFPIDWLRIGLVFVSALVIGIVLSVLAAILPAYQAAKMPAAAALRVEV